VNSVSSRISFAVAILAVLCGIGTPHRAHAQIFARANRASSNAVSTHADSLINPPVANGSVATDSLPAAADKKSLMSPSGDRGTGLSGKVFARFVMPEDWISMGTTPPAAVSSASMVSNPTASAETVFTMRSFGQKVRAWLN